MSTLALPDDEYPEEPEPPRRMRGPGVPAFWKFVFLSMLLHALVVMLFGSTASLTQEGRAMWGAMQVVIRGGMPPLPLKLERELATPPSPTTSPPAEPQAPAMASPARAESTVPPLLDRLPDVEALSPPDFIVPPPSVAIEPSAPKPEARVETAAPKPVTPAPVIPRIAPVRRPVERAIREMPELAAPPAPPSVQPIAPAAPVVERTLRDLPQVPAPAAAPKVDAIPDLPAIDRALKELPSLPTPAAAPSVEAIPVAPAIDRTLKELPSLPTPAAAPRLESLPVTPTPALPVPTELPAMPQLDRIAPPPAIDPIARPLDPVSAPATPLREMPSSLERAAPATTTPPPAAAPPVASPPASSSPVSSSPATPAPSTVTPGDPTGSGRSTDPTREDSPFRRPVPRPQDYDPTVPMSPTDMEAAKKRASQLSRQGVGNRALFALPLPVDPKKSKMEDAIEKARKPDCRTAYKEMGLIAVIPLVANEFGEGTCRW